MLEGIAAGAEVGRWAAGLRVDGACRDGATHPRHGSDVVAGQEGWAKLQPDRVLLEVGVRSNTDDGAAKAPWPPGCSDGRPAADGAKMGTLPPTEP